MLHAKLIAIKRKLASVGLLPTIRLIGRKLFDLIFFRENLLFYVDTKSYSVDYKNISRSLAAREVISFKDLTDNEIATIEDYAGKKYVDILKKRLSNHWRLFICSLDGQLAGAGWAISRESGFETKVIPLFDGSFALIDFWTLPAHRGNNVYSFLLSFIATNLKKKGFLRLFISANERNIGSIVGIRKAGYSYLINYEIYNFLGYEIVIWKRRQS